MELGRELQKQMDTKICNVLESSCIEPIIDDHFKSSLASNASTEKSDSKPTENPGRQFDGLSYFGGILTACGTAAIAFVGIKLYQSRKNTTEDYNLMNDLM